MHGKDKDDILLSRINDWIFSEKDIYKIFINNLLDNGDFNPFNDIFVYDEKPAFVLYTIYKHLDDNNKNFFINETLNILVEKIKNDNFLASYVLIEFAGLSQEKIFLKPMENLIEQDYYKEIYINGNSFYLNLLQVYYGYHDNCGEKVEIIAKNNIHISKYAILSFRKLLDINVNNIDYISYIISNYWKNHSHILITCFILLIEKYDMEYFLKRLPHVIMKTKTMESLKNRSLYLNNDTSDFSLYSIYDNEDMEYMPISHFFQLLELEIHFLYSNTVTIFWKKCPSYFKERMNKQYGDYSFLREYMNVISSFYQHNYLFVKNEEIKIDHDMG